MKKILVLICVVVMFVQGSTFWDIYGKGGEISTYKTEQPRYGQQRSAYTVLIFVTEVINKNTRIKVEDFSRTPDSAHVRVMKMNRALQFNTGIYNYSVMTSVFADMQNLYKNYQFYPLKMSITVSEWCGNFFEQLLTDGKGARKVMHSYFEAEGDRDDYIAAPENSLYEDDLPVLIREFTGEFLKPGDKRDVMIIPSLWQSRITHQPLAYEKGWIKKEKGEPIMHNGALVPSYKWTWQVGNRTEEYLVAKDYPHTILAWKGSDGETGTLIKTKVVPYWNLHANKDLSLRKELGLPALE